MRLFHSRHALRCIALTHGHQRPGTSVRTQPWKSGRLYSSSCDCLLDQLRLAREYRVGFGVSCHFLLHVFILPTLFLPLAMSFSKSTQASLNFGLRSTTKNAKRTIRPKCTRPLQEMLCALP